MGKGTQIYINMKTLRIYRILELLSEELTYIGHLTEKLCKDVVASNVSGGAARRKAEKLNARFAVLTSRIMYVINGLGANVSNKMATEINKGYTLCFDKLNWLLFNKPTENHIRIMWIYEK